MPLFQFSPYDYANTGTLAELMLRAAQPRADALRLRGERNASAVGSIGALIANIQPQIAAEKAMEQERQIRALQIAAAQHEQELQPVRDAVMARSIAQQNLQAQEGQPAANLAPFAKVIGTAPPESLPGVTLPATPSGEVVQGRPEPVQIPGIPATQNTPAIPGMAIAPRSAEDLSAAAAQSEITKAKIAAAYRALKPGETIPALGISAPEEPKTEWEAWQQNAPALYGKKRWSELTPTQAEDAFKRYKQTQQNPDAASAEDARYEQIQSAKSLKQPVSAADEAWSNAYEKRKTLTIDTSASKAADRQATSIAASTAQQSRAQTFAEQQAGRKELNDKVETPFLVAKSSANTLRDVVAAAQAGNKVAGSLQSLEATMSAIRAQGLNRINTAEIGVTADSGSMWDRLVGWFGKAEAGQPVPANIQKDMLSFADILEKAAAAKYRTGFDATTKRYRLTDEKPLVPDAPVAGQPITVGAVTVKAPDGVTYSFPSQDAADAFKKRAGIQ